ncbi:MAG: MFS transporter [Gemmatimonadetes bacterium]|jgi:MFS family permease|nr:MFS transporter [Gemmatimonadota bacterium]MBT6149629.1 MFS transporter [Gemmatimonadota bacterium]MBT7861625.1 MFS transporter [Gemmatimonadota bacterium]
MVRDVLAGFDLREYNSSVQRFFLFAIPIFSSLALYSLLYNLYLVRLSYQEDFIGHLAGLFPLASGLVAIPAGILSDRFGRKPLLILASVILGISQLGLCWVTVDAYLLAFSFLGGIGGAFVFVNFIPFLAENADASRRSQAIAIWMSIQVVTRMLVSLVGGALPGAMAWLTGLSTDMPEPFRYALMLGAGLSLVALIPIVGVPSKEAALTSDEEASDESPKSASTPWKHLILFGSISACRGLTMGLSFPFLNVFFESGYSASTVAIGTIFFASMAIGLPSTICAPALGRRFGPGRTIIPLRLIGAVALGMMGWTGNYEMAIALFLVSSVMEAITVPTEMTFATHTLPRAYWARMQSLRVAGFQILSGLGSFWAGGLIIEYGYDVPFALAGVARVGSSLLFLAAFGFTRRSGGTG